MLLMKSKFHLNYSFASDKNLPITTYQQTSIYNQIIQAVNKNEGDMFFLYGYGGTGKTFIWKMLTSSLRADFNFRDKDKIQKMSIVNLGLK